MCDFASRVGFDFRPDTFDRSSRANPPVPCAEFRLCAPVYKIYKGKTDGSIMFCFQTHLRKEKKTSTLTPFIVTHGTNWWGGFKLAVFTAIWCSSWLPRPLCEQFLMWPYEMFNFWAHWNERRKSELVVPKSSVSCVNSGSKIKWLREKFTQLMITRSDCAYFGCADLWQILWHFDAVNERKKEIGPLQDVYCTRLWNEESTFQFIKHEKQFKTKWIRSQICPELSLPALFEPVSCDNSKKFELRGVKYLNHVSCAFVSPVLASEDPLVCGWIPMFLQEKDNIHFG